MSEPHLIGGRFELHELIGQGGMGDVFRGVDTRSGETVAIKSLKPDITAEDPQLIERFVREGDALRQLNHPSIVKMLAALEEGGRHYLVMEYVSGGTLAQLLRETPQIPVDRVLEIALDLADALTRAHRLKIIHRDIKPQNVMLAEDGTPRLTDFGVAHLQDRTRVTETGSMLGTYAYLSPEACMGDALDTRSDIWAFGVMLYEMLAGRRPFEGNQPASILTAILNHPVPDILQYRPDTPAKLVALISSMLEKDREKRIASVRLVGAQLEAMLSGSDADKRLGDLSPTPSRQDLDGPTVATPTPSFAQTPPVTQVTPKQKLPRRWLAVGAALVIVLLGALILPGALNQPTDAGNPLFSEAVAIAPVEAGKYMVLVAQLEHLGGEERDVTRFIVDDLEQQLEEEVPFSLVAIREYPAVITSDEDALTAAEANGASLVIWGNYDDSGIELAVQIGSLNAFPNNMLPRDLLEDTVNVRLQMMDARRESVAPQVLAVMNVLHTGAGSIFEIARNLVILDVIDVTGAEVIGNSPAAYWHRYFALFTRDTESAVEIIDDAVAQNASNPIFFLGRSIARQRLGQLEAARRDAESARQLGPEGWTSPLTQLAQDAMFFRNDASAALDYYNQIVEAQPDDWMSITFRGIIHYGLGDYDLAQTDLERAASLGSNANFGYAYLMALALRDGRIADARALFDTILASPDPEGVNRIMEIVYGGSVTNNYYGLALSAVGNTTLRQWDAVIGSVDAAAVAGYETADLYFLQGFAYCNLDDNAAAEAAYTRGIELDPSLVLLYALRAEVRRNQGDLLGAAADAATVAQSEQAEGFAPMMAASLGGQLNCKSFLDVDPSLLGGDTAP